MPSKRPVESKARQIKSKTRVRDLGEVFTNKREVDNILALTQATSNRYWRFLEPACGNGNFLEAILRQRLEHLKQDRIEWHPKNREFSVLKLLIYVFSLDYLFFNFSNSNFAKLDIFFGKFLLIYCKKISNPAD